MFHAVDLLAGPSAPRWRPRSNDPVDETVKHLRGRVRRVPHPAVPPLRLPLNPTLASPLIDELARLGDANTLAAVAHVVTDGEVILPGPVQPDGTRQYALASVVDRGEEDAQLVVLRVQTALKKRKTTVVVGAAVTSTTASEENVRAALCALYLETATPEVFIRSRGRGRTPHSYWAGAPRDRSKLPDNWERRLAAAAAVDGYLLVVEPEPAADVRRTAREIADARPELVLLWRPWLPSPTVERMLRQAADPAEVADVDAPGFEDALSEAFVYFETATVVPQQRTPGGPKTVSEAVAMAKARTSQLVYLPSADASAATSPYVRPEAILTALLHLDDIATEYAEGELSGGFESACAVRGLSFAANISQTARQRYKEHYVVTYEGEPVTLGPHLRFGKGPPHACARIYWYVDSVRRVLVIGHVGRHLPDAMSGI
jgi:hypothetical protein